jgi:hypothetical protein
MSRHWMPPHLNQHAALEALLDRIRRTETASAQVMAEVVAAAGVRRPTTHVQRLIEAEAWTEAALAVMELALPQWQLVRLAFDDGEWCCTLARHWQLPEWLDDTVDARHASLPLAILAAFVEARQTGLDAPSQPPRTVPAFPKRRDGGVDALCCDDFT